MNTYECVMAILTLSGVIVAYTQLKASANARFEDIELKRKTGTEQKLAEFKTLQINELKYNKELKYFDMIDNTKPIPYLTIQSEFEKNKIIQEQAHKLLNFYEELSRGVYNGLYDKELVKQWGFNRMKRTFLIGENILKKGNQKTQKHGSV